MDNSQILIIENIKSDVKSFLSDDFSGHDYLHVCRVYNYASHLQSVYGGDLFVISLSCLLHDVDDKKISPDTFNDKKNALNIMNKYSIDSDIIKSVIKIIESISFSEGINVETLEAKIVQDADRIDAIGAIGIARCFSYAGFKHNAIYSTEDFCYSDLFKTDSALCHFFKKLLIVKDTINTEIARDEAVRRTRFLKTYLIQLFDELELNKYGIDITELLDLK